MLGLDPQVTREEARRVAGEDHTGAGLIERRAQVVAAERRVQPARLLRCQPRARDAQPVERRLAAPREVVVAGLEPGDADLVEELRAGLALELVPELEPAPGHQRVPGEVSV